MKPTRSSTALLWLAAGAGLATALYDTRAGFTWLQYGHPPGPDIDETDPLLDEFIPAYEVVERHHVRVAAPAAIAVAAACNIDLAESPIIHGIFKTRELILGAKSDKARSPRTLLAWVKELGWAVLAEIPDREVVLGAVTRPWDANPVFRPLPPQEFAGFHELTSSCPPMSERGPDARDPIQQILKAGELYFVVVFAAGFVLGTIRTLWIVPSFGARRAELMEAPIMFATTVFASRWVVQRLALRPSLSRRIAVGLIALVLLLLAEFTFVLWIRGLTIAEYLAGRDPVTGTTYVVLLAAFALMPSLAGRRSDL